MAAFKSTVFVASLLIVAATSSARAGCSMSPFEFFPDRNDRVHILIQTDAGSFCDNSFREGPGYRFADVSVVKPPPHGLVATLATNHFAYHALPNYKGADQYTIRACAVVGQRKGCSTLIYDVMVR
jgi:hypothetical protein